MRSPRTWRATLHALTGLPVGLAATVGVGGLLVVWSAAAWSLVEGPGGWGLGALYAVTVAAGPLLLAWCVRGLTALQRTRHRTVPAGRRDITGRWLLRPWRADTWRQLGYHALSLPVGVGGGALVALCWSAVPLALVLWDGWWGPAVTVVALVLFLAAPWVARGVADVDVTAAAALLGPGRAEELELRVETLARSRADIVVATDAERRRIERDLHDGAQQRLMSLAMNLGMARAALGDDTPEPARLAIEQAHDEATQALAELREFVRGLHPAVLDDRGLDAALSGIVARAPLPVRLRVDVTPRCSATIEAVAYFVVSEALTNVAKHAHASTVDIRVARIGDRLRVAVTDDGRGGASPDSGTGLRGLAQRVASVDGTLRIDSPAGGPTTLTVELPCES